MFLVISMCDSSGKLALLVIKRFYMHGSNLRWMLIVRIYTSLYFMFPSIINRYYLEYYQDDG